MILGNGDGQRPVSMGLVGAGAMGRAIFHQASVTPGIDCVALCDRNLNKARTAVGDRRPTAVVSSPQDMDAAIDAGRVALCTNAEVIAAARRVAVYYDGSTAVAAAIAPIERAIAARKHVIMMNAEADVMFGPWFAHLAGQHGVVYTTSDGDQPGVIARLAGEVGFWGFQLVMAGNVKGFLDRYTDPVRIRPEAEKRDLNPKMCASYADGTKLAVEMALVANGLGLGLDVPGMHGPRAEQVLEVLDLFALERIRAEKGVVVDFILGGRPRGGVFVVGYTDCPVQRRIMGTLPSEHGPGPFYVFNRPHHLPHMEALRSVFDAARDGKCVLAPRYGMLTQVVAYAKRDLKAGETLDGPGGFCSYGLIEEYQGGAEEGFPICLSEGVRLVRNIPKDARIGWAEVIAEDVPEIARATYRKAIAAGSLAQGPQPTTATSDRRRVG